MGTTTNSFLTASLFPSSIGCRLTSESKDSGNGVLNEKRRSENSHLEVNSLVENC